MAVRPELRQCAGDAAGLQRRELHGQRLALGGDVEEPLATIAGALLLQHIALVDQLLEHAPERLLGDLQDIEELGNLHPGIAVDEMQHPMMGAAEIELGERIVGIADEIPIGEEQKLDDVPNRGAILGSPVAGDGGRAAIDGWKIYVSHIDIFPVDRYRDEAFATKDFVTNRPCLPAPHRTVIALPAQARSHGAARTCETYRVSGRDAKASPGRVRDFLRHHRTDTPKGAPRREPHGQTL